VRTRERIIQASIELFNEHGERQITTNHIAAHLGISPGNLYYHFRNKSDIIHNIFLEYKNQLESSFTVEQDTSDAISLLRHSLDSIFGLMWRFSFFYSNLPDILSRDTDLQTAYLDVQGKQMQRMLDTVTMMKESGKLNIDEEDIPELVNAIKVTATFWISYIKTQQPNTTIDKSMVYKGVLTVLLLIKPYLNNDDREDIKTLQQHYTSLAELPA
jgi:AcrR family transcriptional regulator